MQNQQHIIEKYIKSSNDLDQTQVDTICASMNECGYEATLAKVGYSPGEVMDPDLMKLFANALLHKLPQSNELRQTLLNTKPDDSLSIPAQIRRVLALNYNFIYENKGFKKLFDTLNELLIEKTLEMERPDVLLNILSERFFPYESDKKYTLYGYRLYQGTAFEMESLRLRETNIPLIAVAILYCASYDMDFIISRNKDCKSSNTNNSNSTGKDLSLLEQSDDIKIKYKTWNQIAQLLIMKDELTDKTLRTSGLIGRGTLIDDAVDNGQNDIVSSLLGKLNLTDILSMASTNASNENRIPYFTESCIQAANVEFWLEKMDQAKRDNSILKIWALLTVQKLSPMGFSLLPTSMSRRKSGLVELISLLKSNQTITRDEWINHIYNALEFVEFSKSDENERWENFRSKLSTELDRNHGRLYSKIAKLLKSRDCESLTELLDKNKEIDFNHAYHFREVNIPANGRFDVPLTLIKVLTYFIDADLKAHRTGYYSSAMLSKVEQKKWAALLSNLIKSKRISPELLNVEVIPNNVLLYYAILSEEPALARAIIEAGGLSCSCGDKTCTLHELMVSFMRSKSGYVNLLSKIGFDKDAKLTKPLIMFFKKFLNTLESDKNIDIADDTDELLILQHMIEFLKPGFDNNIFIKECGIFDLRDALCDAVIDHAIVNEKPEVLLAVLNDKHYKFNSGKLYHYEGLNIRNFPAPNYVCIITAKSILLISIAIKYCSVYQSELAAELLKKDIPDSDQFKIKHNLWKEIVVKLLAKDDLTHAILSKQALGNSKFTVLDTAVAYRQEDVVFDLLKRHPIPKFTGNILDDEDNSKFWLGKITPECNTLVLKLWAVMLNKRLSEMSYNTTLMFLSKRKGALEALTALLESKNEVTYDQWADHIYDAQARVTTFDPVDDAVWLKLREKLFILLNKNVQIKHIHVLPDADSNKEGSSNLRSLVAFSEIGKELTTINKYDLDQDVEGPEDGTKLKKI